MRSLFRQMFRAPGFTLTVALVLALGVGATTAIFSVVHAVLLHPFPYVDGNRLLFIGSTHTNEDGQMPVTYPDYLDWRKNIQSVDHLAYASGSAATLTGVVEPAVLRRGAVTAPVWPLLGLPPELGRVFTDSDDRPAAAPVCVLSHATWQKHFAADPAILGRAITLDGKSYTVIGVMPPAFKFWAADVWTPAGLEADTDMMRSRVLRMDSWVVTRPKTGRTEDDVRAELGVIAHQLAQQYPDSNKDLGVRVRLLAESVSGPFRRPLLILLGAVAGVLLIACANVANLLLARTSSRRREFAVRAALGASRGRLVGQTLRECLPLALLGGGAGLVLAVWGLDGLLAILPQDAVPIEAQIRVNGPVMLFSLAITLGTMVLFALFPALESSRAAVSERLHEGARGTASRAVSRVRAGLIIAEVALSLTLLVFAGLLIRSLGQLQAIDPGFKTENLLVIPVQLPESRYASSEAATAFFETALERVRALPFVSSAAATTNAPFLGGTGLPMVGEGQTYKDVNEIPGTQFALVTADYFAAQGLHLARGRTFTAADDAGSDPVIILSEAALKKFLPEGNPIGRRVLLGVPENFIKPGMLPPGFDRFHWSTVVGVVSSPRHFGLDSQPAREAYLPVRQGWDFPLMRRSMTILVRTKTDPLALVPTLRQVLHSLDADLPLQRISPMNLIIADSLQMTRFNAVLLGLFAGTALALALVGIYGVVAWTVTQRTREIGVRVALGADRHNVLRLVIGQSMRVVLIGLGLGLLLSLGVTRFLQNQLFGVGSFDPVTFLGVAALLAAAALLACWLPARRATKVDPMIALRAE